ncbi:MAG: ABC transporter permease [Actinomycetota bacterium]|nr:ABC transporter permease [Actinomycetota bacterium]
MSVTDEQHEIDEAEGHDVAGAPGVIAAPHGEAGAGEPSGGGGRVRHLLSSAAPPLVVFVLFLIAWQVMSRQVVTRDNDRGDFLMAPPGDVWSEAFADGDNLAEALGGLWVTGRVTIIGLVLAIVLGVGAAVLMSQASWVERSFYPYAVVLQTIPIIALVPLIGVATDYGMNGRILVCIIISFFPIVTNTLFGLRSAEQGHHDLFTLHGAGRGTRLRKLMFPAALPAMFTGFRIAAGLSVIGAIVGDFFFRRGEKGIGQWLYVYQQNLQTSQLYGAIFWSSLFGIVMFWSFGLLGDLLTRSWHDSTSAGGRTG